MFWFLIAVLGLMCAWLGYELSPAIDFWCGRAR
jgi:hypothetical protein